MKDTVTHRVFVPGPAWETRLTWQSGREEGQYHIMNVSMKMVLIFFVLPLGTDNESE